MTSYAWHTNDIIDAQLPGAVSLVRMQSDSGKPAAQRMNRGSQAHGGML